MPRVFEYFCMQGRCILYDYLRFPRRHCDGVPYVRICVCMDYCLISLNVSFPQWRCARDGLFEVSPSKRATAPVSYIHESIEVFFSCYCRISLNVSFRNGGVYFVAHLWFHCGNVRQRPSDLLTLKLKTCKFCCCWISLDVSLRKCGVYLVAYIWFHRSDVWRRPLDLYIYVHLNVYICFCLISAELSFRNCSVYWMAHLRKSASIWTWESDKYMHLYIYI